MRLGSTLLWSCYLGASWTWVIGMLLPVLLLRDYGPWGWVAFATPNVVGAAAFGFVLDKRRSARLVAEHPSACLGFSRVTMAFQVIVLPWALVELFAWPLRTAVLASMAAYAVVLLATYTRPLVTAAVVTAASAALLGWFSFHDAAWVGVFASDITIAPRQSSADLIAFAAAAAFGFLLCPYLDLTFHHARQQAGPAAFALGFGVVFPAMIVLALAYSGVGAITMSDGVFPVAPGPLRWLLGAFVIVQSAFTVGVHLEQVRRLERTTPLRIALPLVLFLLIGALLMLKYPRPVAAFDMSVCHMIYRVLLLLFGTIFPVYVLVMMIPIRRPVRRRSRLRVALFAGGMTLPMAWIAFVEGRGEWVVGIGVIFVLARFAAARLSPTEA